MVNMHSLDYIRIIYNMMKVWYLFYSSLESTELVNQIIPHIKQIEDDDNPLVIAIDDDYYRLSNKNVSRIIVNKGLFKDLENELLLNDFSRVQFILINEESFRKISCLTIANLPELRFLEVGEGSFYNTTSLTLSSIF